MEAKMLQIILTIILVFLMLEGVLAQSTVIPPEKDTQLWTEVQITKPIVKDKIDMWKHFSVIENKSEIENDYFVQAIPQKILIDKNGIII